MNKQEIEKAIDCLKKMYVKSTKMVDGRRKGGYINKDQVENKAIDMAISTLEQQLADAWVPVTSGRMPEIPEKWINDGFHRVAVLTSTKSKDMAVIRWFDIENGVFYDDFDSLAMRDEEVEAWMYLPKVYKPQLYKEVSDAERN